VEVHRGVLLEMQIDQRQGQAAPVFTQARAARKNSG
jgi:hypothetical protein